MNRAWIAAMCCATAIGLASVAQARVVYYPLVIWINPGPGSDKVSAWETGCQKGRPPSETQVQNARASADHLMTDFSKLGPNSSVSDVRRVFNTRDPTSLWRDGTGLVQANQIEGHLAGPIPTPTLVNFVAGGDGQSGHGVWQIPADGPDAKPTYYVAEFRVSGGSVFPGWKIWRMAIVQGDAPPPAAQPFCHLNAGAMW
jgi:hypothetical protein